MNKNSFASDNYAGCLPEMLEEIESANKKHAPSYGNDEITEQAIEQFKIAFDKDIVVRFVFNGTGANVLSMSCITQSFNAILCASSSHLFVDESTAPETFTNCRLVPLQPNSDGKLELETIRKSIIRKGDEHHPQIKALSITQPTENGTVYSLEELAAIGKLLQENDMYFHIDGARLFNAVAHLNCTLAEMT